MNITSLLPSTQLKSIPGTRFKNKVVNQLFQKVKDDALILIKTNPTNTWSLEQQHCC